jgi:dynein heavy chain, axonemal
MSYDKKIRELAEQARVYNTREDIVGKERKDYSKIQKMLKDFQPFYTLWTTINQWKTDYNNWMNGKWEDLNAEQLVSSFEVCLKNMSQAVRFFGQDTEEAKEKFKEILPIAKKVKEAIDEFKPIVPLAEALRKEGMLDRHWDQLSEAVGFDIRPEEGFTLTTVVNLGMKKHVAKAEEIGEKAFKEFHIEKSLRTMKAAWENQFFKLPKFKNTGTCTIAGFDEAIALLDEHIVNSQAFQFSPFKKPFEEEIN